MAESVASDHKVRASVDEARLEFANGPKLNHIAQRTDKPWYRIPHLLKLNLLLIIPLLTSYVVGFDGSVLNGMQSVPSWQYGMCRARIW